MRVLNVGCGLSDISDGFPEAEIVRMDIDRKVKPDVVHDIRTPFPKKHREAYDVVYTSHTLEHISWRNVKKVFGNLVSAVVPGGELWVIVPSLEWCGMELMKDQPSIALIGTLFGSQQDEYQYHKSGYTMMLLRQLFALHELVVRQAYQSFYKIAADGWEADVGQLVMIGSKIKD